MNNNVTNYFSFQYRLLDFSTMHDDVLGYTRFSSMWAAWHSRIHIVSDDMIIKQIAIKQTKCLKRHTIELIVFSTQSFHYCRNFKPSI